MKYADYTRNTTEPLKRIAHTRRYQQVVDLIARPIEVDTVLDYGCGDAHLFSYFIGQLGRTKLVGYDPNPKILSQASSAVSAGAQLTTDIDALLAERPGAFSLIYCMEVCEHLTEKALLQLFQNIRTLAAPRARVIIGVPIETGPSGFLKALYRMSKGGRQSASFEKAVRSLVNVRIAREVTDVEWFGSHTGFSHINFRKTLQQNQFEVRKTYHLPFPLMRSVLNNEIYFVCGKMP
ncbi:class I SAM-dependent methyltransferase [Bradyrhizobium canariense]|uniref:Methyltransferase domain-containing protein n=1 Tax=Bradyrhizobium canariense TaxID=255045 RepID=A0A1H1VJ73_9BRAD|nr:class I SAM-dependent methyltransferase [Bradyrhizobium canariense]SDS84775.1 Methyltransferase domain-containing protein [Bradyrhizobium canariense]